MNTLCIRKEGEVYSMGGPGYGTGFALIVVLFILLVIVGAGALRF
ncbi:YjcZ family sporulation protein [Bacillus sp. CSS-39]|jgi:uncharacterized protein (TIGR01732 family)